MSNFLDGLDPKQSTDTLTASEWNFLINSLKNMRFTDLSDVSVDIAQEGEVPVLVGGGWVPAPMTGGGGTPVEVNWNTLVGKPFGTINLNDFIVIGNELNIVASLKTPDWNNIQNKPIDIADNKLMYGSCEIYHSCNSNLEYVDWKAGTLRLSDGVNESLIQVKTQSSLYRTILEYDQSLNKINIGRSSSVLGIGLYFENIEIATVKQNLFYVSKGFIANDYADFYGDIRMNTANGIGRAITRFGQELAIGSSSVINGVSLFYGTYGKKLYTTATGVVINNNLTCGVIYGLTAFHLNHGSSGAGNALTSSGDDAILQIGYSGVTKGVELYHGLTKIAETQSDGLLILNNLGVNGEAKAGLFYTGEVSDLNDIKTNVYRGLEVMRYSQGAANKPVDGNNANGLLNIYSHGTGYGKQIAFGDSDDLYIRRMTAGSFGGWKKLYHDGNSNRSDVSWDMNNGYINGALTIRGSTVNNRLQMWGTAPYMSFHDEVSDNRWAYIQAHSGNLLLDVAGINNSLDFRVGGFKRCSVGKWGYGVESGSIYKCFGKHGTSWNDYNYADTAKMGALDVQLVNDASASWIWSVRDYNNSFKAGFQILNNGQYSQLHLSNRCKIIALDSVFEFYIDGQKVAELNSSGTFRAASDVQAQVNF